MRNLLYFCLFALISSGCALKCFECESETLYGCRPGSLFLRQVSCGLEHPNFFRFCLGTIIYDKMLGQTKVHMGCDLLGKHARIKEVGTIPQCDYNRTRYELRECRMCGTDLCSFDGSNVPSPNSLYFYIFILLVYLCKL